MCKEAKSVVLGFGCLVFALVSCQRPESPIIQDGIQRVGPSQQGFQNPVWSPDGTKIAVTTQSVVQSWTSEIFVLDVLTGQKTSILYTDRGNVMAIAWSPDGSQLLLASQNGGDWPEGIWTLNFDGKASAEFVTEGYDAAWSPDGTKIAVFSHSEKGAHQDVMLSLLNVETGDREVIFGKKSTNVSGGGVEWSPTGEELVFDYGPSYARQLNLYILNVATKVTTRISGSGQSYNPSWGPSGDLLVFVNDPGNGQAPSLFRVDKKSTCQQQLLTLDDLWGSSWSPDGKFIAFISRGDVYLLDLERFPSYESACP